MPRNSALCWKLKRERGEKEKGGEREREEKKDDCERRLLCCQNEKFLFVVGGE